jgi:hypothetical protein
VRVQKKKKEEEREVKKMAQTRWKRKEPNLKKAKLGPKLSPYNEVGLWGPLSTKETKEARSHDSIVFSFPPPLPPLPLSSPATSPPREINMVVALPAFTDNLKVSYLLSGRWHRGLRRASRAVLLSHISAGAET